MLDAIRRLLQPPRPAAAQPAVDWKQQGNDFLARGELAEATRCYRSAAAADANDAAARLSLGYALLEQQQFDAAGRSLREVLGLQPRQHEAHFLLGRAERATGRLEEAAKCHARALECSPGFDLALAEWSQACLELGQRSLNEGQPEAARHWFEQVVSRRPSDAAAQAHLGLAWESLGRMDAAEDCYRRALVLQPGDPQALFGLGNVFMLRQDPTAAAVQYAGVLERLPGHAMAATNLAQALVATGRYEAAMERFGQVLQAQPGDPLALVGRANCLLALERNTEALAAYDQLLIQHPALPQAHLNRGNALVALGRDDQALQSFRQAVAVRPGYVEALVNIGTVLQRQNRFDEAIALHQQAVAQDPANAAAHWNLGLCRLVLGDLEGGWPEAEWRWQALQREPYRGPQPQWTGAQPIAGKTILLHSEQGLGDTIQFVRYVQMLAQRGAIVLLRVQPVLASLLKTLRAPFRLVPPSVPLPEFDYHCPLLSLPLAFGTTLATIPAQVPYLASQPALAAQWRERLGANDGRRWVGLVWSGNAIHVNDSNRSLPLASLAGLASPGLRLVSLQKEVRDSDTAALEASPIAHYGELLTDFEQTAALIDCVDVVVTVDTSVAHLAGALGKPVWLLLPFSPDWRWLVGREDSPWYPTARLYRQQRAGDWGPVIARMQNDLQRLAS